MNLSYFTDLIHLGLKPIPIKWDAEKKAADSHLISHSNITESYYNINDFATKIENCNGIALKLFAPFAILDFDLKNTKNKHIFRDWLAIIESQCPEVLRKICIEETRNAGYHVYIKFAKVSHKVAIANSDTGAEVVALYTGGLLSYCTPTPGYTMFHNSWEDIEELTQDEFDLLTSTASLFNEYVETFTKAEATRYPLEYETLCFKFDTLIPDEIFEQLLNEMNLFEVRNFRYNSKQKFTAYLRKGSESEFSAKVYFQSRKALLFTTSIPGYPTWADNKGTGDKGWVLTPAKIIYYRSGRNWVKTIETIRMMADSIGINIEPTKQEKKKDLDNVDFPYDIFPQSLQDYITSHTIQHEYLAAFFLTSLATAIGNTAYLEALDGWYIKPSLYLAVVAHAGGAKSPALKIAYEFITATDTGNYKQHKGKLAEYNEMAAGKDKGNKGGQVVGVKPVLQQMVINDATIETVINVLQFNSNGCTLVSDELAGWMQRMNAYKMGDDVQKWLEIWDSSPVMLQRMSREESKIVDYICNVVGGIQPGVLEQLSQGDNQHNGFYHRFLFCYPTPKPKADFEQLYRPTHLKAIISDLFASLMSYRVNQFKDKYALSNEARTLYKQWHDTKNVEYNTTADENRKGIIAKYQAYCLRFALILQLIEDNDQRTGVISEAVMERAIRLTEYFLRNMDKALRLLAPSDDTLKLKEPYASLYQKLPEKFEFGNGFVFADALGIKSGTFKSWLSRNKNLFVSTERGHYEKVI